MIESVFVGVAGAVVVCFLLWLSAELYARALRMYGFHYMGHQVIGLEFRESPPGWYVLSSRLRRWGHQMVDRL